MDKKLEKRILITGATGYLGSSIALALEDKGFCIYKGTRNKSFLQSNQKGNWVHTDWESSDYSFLKGYNYIIHAAGPSAEYCSKNPKSSEKFYETLNLKLLDNLVLNGVEGIILLSTVHVYSSSPVGTLSESSKLENKHPYVRYRKNSEEKLIRLVQEEKLKGCVLRLSNCFGSLGVHLGEFSKLFINQACKEVMTKKTLTVKSNSSNKRDFLPIQLLLKAIIQVLKGKNNFPLYNLVSGETISLREVANDISNEYKRLYGGEIEVNLSSSSSLDLPKFNFDKSRISEILTYSKKDYLTEISNLLLEERPST